MTLGGMLTTPGILRCPGCGREFAWNARFAGRKARCACGYVIEYPSVPISPDLSGDEMGRDPYAIAPATPQKATRVKPVEALPMSALVYRSGAPGAVKRELDVDKLTKQTLPLWLLTIGLLVEGGITYLRATYWSMSPNIVLLYFLLDVGVGTLVMMAGVLIAARVRQIPIGSIPGAMLRLAALIIATDAASDILMPIALFIPAGGILLLLVNFALYFALLGTFFDLDESDTWYCVSVIFILHVAMYFGVRFLWN